MKYHPNTLSVSFILLLISITLSGIYAQPAIETEAGLYFNSISDECTAINKELWNYISAFVHGRSARKIEAKRIDLVQEITNTTMRIGKIPVFDGRTNLRDSVIAYLKFLQLPHFLAKGNFQ